MINKVEIGKKIRKSRELNGLSITELAREVNMTISQVSDIESGRNLIGLKTLEKFVKALGITFYNILDEKENLNFIKKTNDKLLKYAKIIDFLENDPELTAFIIKYSKNKEKFKSVKYIQFLNELSNFSIDEQKVIFTHLRSTMKLAKGKK